VRAPACVDATLFTTSDGCAGATASSCGDDSVGAASWLGGVGELGAWSAHEFRNKAAARHAMTRPDLSPLMVCALIDAEEIIIPRRQAFSSITGKSAVQ